MMYLLICWCLFFQALTQAFILQTISPVATNPKLCYFSGAGIYFWWQLGVAKYMKESCTPDVFSELSFIGASAGSITSTLLLSGADLDKAPSVAVKVANRYNLFSKKTGLAVVWGQIVRDFLTEVIPDEVDVKKLSNLQIALTPPFGSPKLVSGFYDKKDLISAILASCHVPVFLDGRPYTMYRGERFIDGSFWYFVTKDRYTGLPLPKELERKDIFWVDYTDDEDFMSTISGNILELVTVEVMYEMVESGYNFMKREHSLGRFPLAKYETPMYFTSPIFRKISTFPGQLRQVAGREMSKLNFYKVTMQ